jgi:hypothetical protein
MLNNIKYTDKNADVNSDESIYNKEIEYLMECFTKTACRKVMKQISKHPKLSYEMKNTKLEFYNSDKKFGSLRLDVLIEFPKRDDIPDIIIDVKTNKKLSEKNGKKYIHHDNIHQIYTYHDMYTKHHHKNKDNVACILHYISSDKSGGTQNFNNSTIYGQKSMRMFVYKIDSERFNTEDVESYIKNLLQNLIEKGKDYVEYDRKN